ncbi:arginase family protein [Amycolatopsis balhimycina DSM 5908]|uniref:Arginase family protein n=1 Tax=Amycolatopsis balhimycina DSM 5908 TaxID=1081091 RepID=A0A428W1P6_AMYBA|nr:arginase family protein [Amycolatopsis balhimycina]RSM36963.1 arginase family protein [Amycolatopsis balhimycina DSM 5908]
MLINAVPQRQGAVGPRATELPDGCVALAELAGHVLSRPVHYVRQTHAVSEVDRGIASRAVLTGPNRVAQLAALEAPGGPVLTIGGDCGVELVPIGVARYRYGPGLGVVWFDAHPDLNTPDSSPSGAFHGMVLRSLFGEGDPEFAADPALTPGNVALAGARVFDPAEQAAVDGGLVVTPVEALTGVEKLYVHVDLDVLDPSEFPGLNYPEPGGWTIPQLVAALDALSGYAVVGAGITECVGTPREVEVLEPVIAAIGRLLSPRRPVAPSP